MASNIQKSDEQAVLNAIAKIAGLKQGEDANARIKSFCEAAGLDAQALLNDENGVMNEFIESLESGAIAPSAPTGKAAKRGRKTKSTEVPRSGMQNYQSRVGAEIAGMQEAIEGHLSQWEEAQAQALLERFEATPGNILSQVNQGLEVYSDDADFFRESVGSALSELLPIS